MSNYNEYLQSPEWKELRKKACERVDYKCEFCGADYEAVHHVQYPKNLKDDVLENLVVVCKVCHDKLHGIRKEERKSTVYLAGKITNHNWRQEIFPDITALTEDPYEFIGVSDYKDKMLYNGPFFMVTGCECGIEGCQGHCDGEYVPDALDNSHSMTEYFNENSIAKMCRSWIESSDYVFAYIYCSTCYGTLIEIGWAQEMGKKIFIHFQNKKLYDEMWFVRQSTMATFNETVSFYDDDKDYDEVSYGIYLDSKKKELTDGWDSFVKYVAITNKKVGD